MDPGPGLNSWNVPPQMRGMNPRRRAAYFVWGVGIVEILLFGCCSLGAILARSMPLADLQADFAARNPQVSHEQLNQLAQIYQLAWPLAVLFLVVGFLPGLAYALLGFGVRKGRPISTNTALLLAITQTIVFGVIFAVNVAGAVMSENLPALTANFIGFGSLLMVLGFTIFWLFRAKTIPGGNPDQDFEPWNDPRDNP